MEEKIFISTKLLLRNTNSHINSTKEATRQQKKYTKKVVELNGKKTEDRPYTMTVNSFHVVKIKQIFMDFYGFS